MAADAGHRSSTSSTHSTGHSDDSDKPKRTRQSKAKVKTGCRTCKERRIKCDEARPACRNCVKAKKECLGYPAPPRSAVLGNIAIAPRPAPIKAQPVLAQAPVTTTQTFALPPRRASKAVKRADNAAHTSLTLYRPAGLYPFDQQDSLYFQLFQTQIFGELSGYFDSVFWSRTVLQECHAAESIRQAVVALGALYKCLEKWSESPPSSPNDNIIVTDTPKSHWNRAINAYSRALKAQKTAQGDNTAAAMRTRLMAIVLLASFDSFVGDHETAIIQIQSGLSLLENLRRDRRRQLLAHPEEPVEDDICQMFTRLAIQAKSYDMAFHFPKPYVIRLNMPEEPSSPSTDGGSNDSFYDNPIPERFYSLLDARVAWDRLVEKMLRFTETLFLHASADGPMGVLPAPQMQYVNGFKHQIQAWIAAFEPILASRSAPGVTEHEKTGAAVLKMYQMMCEILLFTTFSNTESIFDHFGAGFRAIVGLALEVVGDEERRAKARRCPDPDFCTHREHHASVFGGHEYLASHIKPSFSTDLGIVPPLFVVASKCRDPALRRQAIQLLKSSARREGMWDSELLARIGNWLVQIEEADDLLTPDDSPRSTLLDFASPARSYGSLSPDLGHMNGNGSRPGHGGAAAPLGPGGNAKWDLRRASHSQTSPMAAKTSLVPDEKRVMIRAARFNLREQTASITCGSRKLRPGQFDSTCRTINIEWGGHE